VTYGAVRFRCSKLVPGIDPDLIDGWIEDRYTQILDRLKWKRLDVRSVIQTSALYTAGTVDLVNGSKSIVGTGTAWLETQTGMGFRIGEDSEYYTFTQLGTLLGELDRPFEGVTGTYSYKLFQSVYPLPEECKILTAVTNLQGIPLAFMDRNRSLLRKVAYGQPQEWRWLMDDASEPPRMQIEIYPIPNLVTSLAIEFTAEEGEFGRNTATTLLPWVSPGCLVAGVESDMQLHLEKFAHSDRLEARFQNLLMDMQRTDTANTRPQQIRLARSFMRRMPGRAIDRFDGGSN
jgi:hypothetical protein